MTHRYRPLDLGVYATRYLCSCGWESSVVRRDETSIAYAQWQGHRSIANAPD